MKMNKSTITYVVLSCALVGCIISAVILGINLFTKKAPVMENFQDKTKEDVLKWVTVNDFVDYVSYEYEYSDTVDEGFVISQSLEPNTIVENNFIITISKGNIINIDLNDYKTKNDFAIFISKYPNVKVNYEGEDKNDNTIERFSKNQIDIKADEITVYLSQNNSENSDNKDNNNNDDKGDKATIPSNLLGIKESDFIKKLNDLGFNNLKKSDTKYYSFTSKADTIFSYDEGNIEKSKTINYALSLGDYPSSFKATDYNNKTLNDANTVVKKYNDLNAHITLKTNNKTTSDNNLVNKLNNCKCSKNGYNSIITCDLYTKEAKSINVESYSNKPETEMLNDLKNKGFTKFTKTEKYSKTIGSKLIISNDTGAKFVSDTIKYVVSKGIYQININDFEGKLKSNADSLISSVNSNGAEINLKTTLTETTDYANDTLFDCSNTIDTISCSLAKRIYMYSIPGANYISTEFSTDSYNSTVTKLKNLLNGFTNVRYNGVSAAIGVGQIVSIKVNGKTDYSPGDYRSDTLIEIDICSEQKG